MPEPLRARGARGHRAVVVPSPAPAALPAPKKLANRFWLAAVAPRLRGGRTMEPVPVARAQSLLISAGLVLATLVLAAGSVGLASIVAAVVALVAALGATGVANAAAEIQRRRRRT